MSNTVITNYTDLNGPSTKADSSVVVIVNKDGSLSVDQNLLGTLMGTDGAQGAISVVRVGHEGKPDDATDSETEDDKIPHVTLTVDSYYDEPNSIIKYDSGAEMLQSLRIETRENSLVGFQNDHCYTPLTPPDDDPQRSKSFKSFDEPIIEITHTPPPKLVPNTKKITILEEQIIPKGKKIVINPTESPVILKGNDVLSKPLSVTPKSKEKKSADKSLGLQKLEDSPESSSSSISSSGESIPDRDSDSDYKDVRNKIVPPKHRKLKTKPRILKSTTKAEKTETKITPRSIKANKTPIRKDKLQKIAPEPKISEIDLESILPSSKISTSETKDVGKVVVKQTPKVVKKEKKTPAHMTALLSDMTSLFSTPDVIRRISTDNKTPVKADKEPPVLSDKKPQAISKTPEVNDGKTIESIKNLDDVEKLKPVTQKIIKLKEKVPPEKTKKPFDTIPQLDEASLAQILQDNTTSTNVVKIQPSITTSAAMNSPGLAGPLSPTLDLLGGLQPEEEGLTEDLLMHVAQLVESSENLQEVIDKQVLGTVDSVPVKTPVQSPFQQAHGSPNLYTQTLSKTVQKSITAPRKEPIEIVRKDGRVITLPPIEAPATRSSKRKNQVETPSIPEVPVATPPPPVAVMPEPQILNVSKQYINKKLANNKKQETLIQANVEKATAESQESWNSEDDPNRLWCICKQPHNNRFMICCDSCEDWFHGKCVNITKVMGQQMEEQGIEWRCPNCVKKFKVPPKTPTPRILSTQKKPEASLMYNATAKESPASKTNCIVCKKPARASSIYCSDACILKHAQDSLGNPAKIDGLPGKTQEKLKTESRVIVYERKSGRLLAGPNAPTAENLKAWLQRNPTFEVVRPGTLSTIKPNTVKKKSTSEPNKIQTTLNFERIPRKTIEQSTPKAQDVKEKVIKMLPSPKEEVKLTPQAKTPVSTRSNPVQIIDTPRPSTSTAKVNVEPRKIVRSMLSRQSSTQEKPPVASPSTSRRKDPPESRKRMESTEPIRDNVRKGLQEQMTLRMAENSNLPKLSDKEIQEFANNTELELFEMFRDVGVKYKAKYRSLMFNVKDRKNLTLWEKICDKTITPKKLVRLSPEEMASQELAQWREDETKHQLELIKKSELDLLAASKTYVLKTHKGEEVMETKEAVSTELDLSVPVEDVVQVLNEAIAEEPITKENSPETNKYDTSDKKHGSNRKRNRENSTSNQTKKSRRDSKREERKKSRSSRRKSDSKDKESRDTRSTRRSDKKTRSRSSSKDRSKTESKEKSGSSDRSRSRHRSTSRAKSRRRSKSREHSRSTSQSRDRSRSRHRSRHREEKRRRSESKHSTRTSTDEKQKLRSRSQENVKSKNDSTDSDSIERPKSAMMKEVHPEYDPHEPMITSAFSEEDLRKSREDVFEDRYNSDLSAAYDPVTAFSIDTEIEKPSPSCITKQDKHSEAESDQEPTSTVETAAATVWNGCINMVDVARFYVAAHEVSGSALDLEEDLTTELDIVGRINPDTVWDYIAKMKKAGNKDIVILRLQAANDEEKMQYIALYSYLSSRNRLGVVKVSNTTTVKDFYIVPLAANTALPSILLPLEGPGLCDAKTHLLIGIVIRLRKKRLPPHIPKDIIPSKVCRESRKRSYTPPIVGKSPPLSPRRRALPLPGYTSTLSTCVKDKIAASLACADDGEEAYSPGSSTSSESSVPSTLAAADPHALRNKMDELNRQIEEQKQQILKISQANTTTNEDEEAYSPSRPMTPPSPGVVPLADIALPSNLQEILATIKQRSENTNNTDVDMRTMPIP